MFEYIKFSTETSAKRLTSKRMTADDLKSGKYNVDAIADSDFSMWGSCETFERPPITDFAKESLLHLEAFCIFHYGEGSYTIRKDYHSFLILYTYGGTGELTFRDKTYELCEGDGAFIDCTEFHRYKTVGTKPWDVGVLHIGGPILPALYEQYMQSGTPVFHESATGHFQQFLEEMLHVYSDPTLYRDWVASAYIDAIVTHLLQQNAKSYAEKTGSVVPENIRYLIKYVESNYNQPLTLDGLSAFANISKFHLSREFKKYTGFSPIEYILELRLDKAEVMLNTTDLPASTIAHEVGIHNMNNFTKQFRKRNGCTPTQYRKN